MKFVPISFHIIKPRSNKILNIIVFIILVIVIVLKSISNVFIELLTSEKGFFLIVVPIMIYINYIFISRSFAKTKNTLRFEDNGIILTIKNQHIYLQTTNISSIKIHLESYDYGMPLTIADYSLKHKRGNGNMISIQTDGVTYNYEFYINTKNDVLHLLKAINTWQTEGLNIEYDRSKRLLND